MPFGIGATEIVILLVVALLVFGPKRLPEMGRSLGRGMREFKDSVSGRDGAIDQARAELQSSQDEQSNETPAQTPAAERARERDTVS